MVMEMHRKQDYAEMTMNQYLIALRLEPYRFCLVLYRLTVGLDCMKAETNIE